MITATNAEMSVPNDRREEEASAPAYQAFQLLHLGFVAAPIINVITAVVVGGLSAHGHHAGLSALGISLADVVAQVRAWYVSEGRAEPRFSETLLDLGIVARQLCERARGLDLLMIGHRGVNERFSTRHPRPRFLDVDPTTTSGRLARTAVAHCVDLLISSSDR